MWVDRKSDADPGSMEPRTWTRLSANNAPQAARADGTLVPDGGVDELQVVFLKVIFGLEKDLVIVAVAAEQGVLRAEKDVCAQGEFKVFVVAQDRLRGQG